MKFTLRGSSIAAIGVGALVTTTGGIALTAAPATQPTKLVVQIHEVKCWDETTGKWREKFGVDTMRLAAVTIDPTGLVQRTAVMKLGDFAKDGVIKTFATPKVLASFPVRNDLKFPINYQAILVLAEKDPGGGFEKQLDAFVKQGRAAALDAKKSIVGVAVESIPDAVASGNVTWETVAAEVGKKVLTAEAKKIWHDDVFKPQMQTLRVAAKEFPFAKGKPESKRTRVIFEGNQGKYHVVFSWKVI